MILINIFIFTLVLGNYHNIIFLYFFLILHYINKTNTDNMNYNYNNYNNTNTNETNEMTATSIENLLIELYNEFNNNVNLNTMDFNYYHFFYIYNIYINMYNDESALYNTILQMFNEYNYFLNDYNDLQTNIENMSPDVVLERNRIKFTIIEKNSDEYTDSCCSICLCDHNDLKQQIIKIKCNHIFHVNCLSKWVTQNKNTCPMCRDVME